MTTPEPSTPEGTVAGGRKVLRTMLERLFASIASGPSLNCRPHNSRQRIDWAQLSKLADVAPEDALRAMLGEEGCVKLRAKVPAPPVRDEDAPEPTEEERGRLESAKRAWSEQSGLLTKLRLLVEEARTYEDDTGVWVLNVGYPLLSMPPGMAGGRGFATRRVLAPIAFVPVSLTVKTGASPSVEIECKSDEIDRVVPNEALIAWLEQQTGQNFGEVFADERGTDCRREIAELTRRVCALLKIDAPAGFEEGEGAGPLPLTAAPRAETSGESSTGAAIVPGAVMGLFPMANEGLLRDTQALAEGGPLAGPIAAFVRGDTTLEQVARATAASSVRTPGDDRLVSAADPCQARAVAMSRTRAGLVIHGPPGTGKSQTITNIIGDHLARGERVLFVCEKRTALDVVANRLEGLGLGELCAVVHDPQRDQKDLYMGIRAQLETLTDAKTDAGAAALVTKQSAELSALHEELRALYRSLMVAPDGGAAFSAMVGEWLALGSGGVSSIAMGGHGGALSAVRPAELEAHTVVLTNILYRAAACGYHANPWVGARAGTVAGYLSRPMDEHRARMSACVHAARELDAWRDERVPPLDQDAPPAAQCDAREALAAMLPEAGAAPAPVRAMWCGADGAWRSRAQAVLAGLAPHIAALAQAPADTELWALALPLGLTLPVVTARIGALEQYGAIARKWWSFLAPGKKKLAGAALAPLGITTGPEGAERGLTFYRTLRAALVVRAGLDQIEGRGPQAGTPDAGATLAVARAHGAVSAAMGACTGALSSIPLADSLAPGAEAKLVALREGLCATRAVAERMETLERAAAESGLLSESWIKTSRASWRAGKASFALFDGLERRLGELEDVLRTGEECAAIPRALGDAALALTAAGADHEQAMAAIRRAVLAGEISRRLESEPGLRAMDARRVRTIFARCAELEAQRRGAVRAAIVHAWTDKHRARLLAATGSRLNSEGASVRQRLTTRGKNALRLRQVLALGRNAEGGDPLLDLRPVWMASPETVSQIFPREPLFDVVVFDEASQLRLEEALPVLTRARRVVVAGDPKQLPPTRFFESAVAQSEAEEIETEAQLFEAQQSQTEDLLSAALSLDIEQSYLDVHYRSRNSDLIEFSNEHFYGSRLQAIPGHPKNRVRHAPLSLVRADGVYEKRTNLAEAKKVGEIIRTLLSSPNPPSIGVGCFNIAQRDLISETLDEMAEEDGAFATALASAKERRSAGAYEGLFIKNLENVQGDERDHIIISTTYGPDAQGRFYRRFGPLAMPGGGRRLNVLVTRARSQVHLVTSIPREQYLALPPVPQGQAPTGGWLLFAYLKFAEELEREYAAAENVVGAAEEGHPEAEALLVPATEVAVRETRTPSALADGLARHISENAGVGSIVHWGNDGFCIDIALRDPASVADVTTGMLCDWTRYANAENPVEWDMFRAAILESQGWELRRVWSPQVFRDLNGVVDGALGKKA